MFEKAQSRRDAFAFSLRGLTTIASFSAPTAIAHDRLAKHWDTRLAEPQEDQPDTARLVEDVLARFFAPGRCRAA